MLLPFDRQDDTWVVTERILHKLTGEPEYEVDVVVPLTKEKLRRQVCWIESTSGNNYWVDTVTGTLYYPAGRCISGTLRFDAEPELSARLITPDMKQRKHEAELRIAAALIGDDYAPTEA